MRSQAAAAFPNGCLGQPRNGRRRHAICFEWGTTTDYGNQIEVGPGTSGGNFSAILANLTPNTTYHFRAKAVGDGTNYGVDMIFATPP